MFNPCENGTPETSSSFEDALPDVSIAGIVLGVGLIVAIVISILPQVSRSFQILVLFVFFTVCSITRCLNYVPT